MIDPVQRWREYGEKPDFAGPLSFGGVPMTQDGRDLEGTDVAIVGAPTDDCVSDRPGTRFGPRAIRAASCPSGPHLEAKVDAFAELRIVDFCDAPVLPGDPVRTHRAIADTVERGRHRRVRTDRAGRRSLDYRSRRACLRLAWSGRARPLRHPHRHRARVLGVRGVPRHADVPPGRGRFGGAGALRTDWPPWLLAGRGGVRLASRARHHEFLHARRPRHRHCRVMAERSSTSGPGPIFLTVDIDVLDPALRRARAPPSPAE